MFNHFGIQNFKVFKDFHEFNLKPITILVGTNSSGKSSLSKGLLALRDSFGEKELHFPPELRLGNFSTTVNNASDSPYMVFEYQIKGDDLVQQHPLAINFMYEKSDTALQNGVLYRISLFDRQKKEPWFIYDIPNNAFILKLGKFNEEIYRQKRAEMKMVSRLKEIKDLIVEHLDNFYLVDDEVDVKEALSKVLAIINSSDDEILDENSLILKNRINFLEQDLRTVLPDFILDLSVSIVAWSGRVSRSVSRFLRLESPSLFDISEEKDDESKIINDTYDDSSSQREKYHIDYVQDKYSQNLNRTRTVQEKKNRLFDFPTAFSEKHLKAFQEVMPENIFIELLEKHTELTTQLSARIPNVHEYIDSLVLDWFDNQVLAGSILGMDDVEELIEAATQIEVFSNPGAFFQFRKNMLQTIRSKDEQLVDLWDLMQEMLTYYLKHANVVDEELLKFCPFKTEEFEYLKGFVKNYLSSKIKDIAGMYSGIHFIPAVRMSTERYYRTGTEESYLHDTLGLIHQTNLKEDAKLFIDKYLQRFGIADGIELKLAEDSSWTKITLTKDGKQIELADVGFGVGQVLPIILKIGYLISEGEPGIMLNGSWTPLPPHLESRDSVTLIIEEPETNLHPALQSKLADMFVECMQKYNMQFIIETHSEYLIRKLQYLTAKKDIKSSDSVLYYFYEPDKIPEGESQVKRIDILEDGSLTSDFGGGFFDEATNWKFELMQLRKAQRN